MIKFLKLIYSASDNVNNEITLKELEDIKVVAKELVDELSEIKKDFKIMEMDFNEEFETLISKNKKALIDSYPDYFKVKEGKKKRKNKSDKSTPLKLIRISEYSFLEQILPQLLFRDFMGFYDKYSSAINVRINEIYETTYERLKKKAGKWFLNSKRLYPEFRKIAVVFREMEYRDIHYFRIILEEKLASNFHIDLRELRRIFYGCKFKNNGTITEYMRVYYNLIFDYRLSSSSTNIDKFLRNCSVINFPIDQLNSIKISMMKQEPYFNKKLSYDSKEASYQPELPSCEDTLNKIEKFGGCYPNIEDVIKKLFPKQQYYPEDLHKLTSLEQLLKYCDYRRNRFNKYSCMLKKIKRSLER